MLREFLLSDSGQALTDYALLISLVTIGLILLVRSLGQHTALLFTKVINEWPE